MIIIQLSKLTIKKNYINSLFYLILKLLKHVEKKRKIQISFLLLLMTLSGFLEVFSLASIIPFISILVSPDKVDLIPGLNQTINYLNFNSQNEILIFLTSIFLFAVILSGLIKLLNLWFSNRLVAAIGCDISCKSFFRTLYQPYNIHISRNSSSIITTTTTETSNTVAFLASALQLIASSIISIFLIISLLIINFKVALISGLVFIISYCLIILFIRKRLKINSEIISRSNKKRVKALQEGLGAIRNIILESSQEFYTSLYRTSDYPLRIRESQNWFLAGAPRYILEAIGLCVVAILALLLTLKSSEISSVIPLIGAIAFGAQRLLPSLQMVYAHWALMKSQTKSIQNVLNLLEQKIPRTAFINYEKSYKLKKSIEFNNVSFKYTNDKDLVLKDINITIYKGEKIGIVGKTGSGKSTFFDILMGLIEPYKGHLYIDEFDIFAENNSGYLLKWQKSISHVPQNIFLSDSSIAENIAFSIPLNQIYIPEVIKAAKKSKIDNLINNLPKKYQTLVGERGLLLSGGERQRIAIARAFYNHLASIYIFDEATSALDQKTEEEILNEITLIDKNKTVFMISHKPKTLAICDRVFEIKDCKINEIKINKNFLS